MTYLIETALIAMFLAFVLYYVGVGVKAYYPQCENTRLVLGIGFIICFFYSAVSMLWFIVYIAFGWLLLIYNGNSYL